MSELNFQIVGARPERHAAVPTLMFALKIEETTGIFIHNIVLRCQIRIEPLRRQYSPVEEARLAELFGETPRWGDTMKPFLWTHLSATIPSFRGETEVELPVACTYDFEIAAAKYLHSLESGDIALLMMFSGSVFEKGEHGMQVSQIPWSKEAGYRLPVQRVAGDDRSLFSEQRMAAPATRDAVGLDEVQDQPRARNLGRSRRDAAA